jgi:glycosyltransferase involved in cell wall biosynthesis
MKIAILLAYESSPYAGAARPFINWAKELRKGKDCDVEFVSLEVGNKVVEVLSKLGFDFCDISSLNDEEYDLILTDDYIERLKILRKIKGVSRKAVYAQILYGVHSISEIHKPFLLKEKLIFAIAKCIPFWILKQRFTKLLNTADVIIANSQTTSNLLHLLYGIESHGVVYPPVDETVFKPQPTEDNLGEVMVYCGSNAGDTDFMLLKQILKLLISSKYVHKTNLLGNRAIYRFLNDVSNNPMINILGNINDSELAGIYSTNILTISPQEWETFGYVPIESVMCGTPVLAFASQPFAELVQNKKIAHLVYSKKELLKTLKEMFNDMDGLRLMKQRCYENREYLLKNVSQKHSSDKLLSILG